MLDHIVGILVFSVTFILFYRVAVSIYISTNKVEVFSFLHNFSSTLSIIVCRFIFDDGYSDTCEVLPQWSFDLHFSKVVMLNIFSCAFFSICVYFFFFFEKCLFRSAHILIVETAMVPHSSTLAWKIPWTEEPGELQSMGSLRVRHD